MNNVFLIKLALSFLVGGLWIIFATVAADKFGSKVGGLIGGLPSTVIVGLFFIAWTQNSVFATQATTIIPIVGGINCIFLVCYIYFINKSLLWAVLSSLILWSILSFELITLGFNSYTLSLFGYIALFLTSLLYVEKILKVKSISGKKVIYSPRLILGRGIIGGLVIALAVYFSKIGGPIVGGMLSMFPAMFTSLMLITYYTHGQSFSASTMKTAMVSSVSVVLYSMVARYTFVPLGFLLGTFISILVSFTSGLVIYKFVIPKLK